MSGGPITQMDIDMLRAAGLNPIVIDENFDFSQLSAMLGIQPKDDDEQVVDSPKES